MRRVINYGLWVMGLAAFLFLTCSSSLITYNYCYAQTLSSTELTSRAAQYDLKVVTYAGEVVGDVMVRGAFAWVNLNDGTNAIGIWVDKNLLKDIEYAASYKAKGDWLEVTGIFHRACPQHGGDLDIHAQTISKIRSGNKVVEEIDKNKRNAAFILLGTACLLLILRQLKRK